MKYQIERPRINRVTDDVIIDELRRVAAHYGHRRFTRHEFDAVAETCKGTVVLRNFSSWEAALDATGLTLTPYRKPRCDQIPVEESLSELARVWEVLGHRPSRTEWESSGAKYSYTTDKTRFGDWLRACSALIAHSPTDEVPDNRDPNPVGKLPSSIPKERSRTVPLRMRLAVLKRDRFRCVLCGRSPATHTNVALHLDHNTPYSSGGKTTADNLRTLCEDCNWGKGNDTQVDTQGK